MIEPDLININTYLICFYLTWAMIVIISFIVSKKANVLEIRMIGITTGLFISIVVSNWYCGSVDKSKPDYKMDYEKGAYVPIELEEEK